MHVCTFTSAVSYCSCFKSSTAVTVSTFSCSALIVKGNFVVLKDSYDRVITILNDTVNYLICMYSNNICNHIDIYV